MSKEQIEAFLTQMRKDHADEIEGITLPEGSEAYIAERIAEGDEETLTFMLKLSYLMGLHTGFAAQQAVEETDSKPPSGALKA